MHEIERSIISKIKTQ